MKNSTDEYDEEEFDEEEDGLNESFLKTHFKKLIIGGTALALILILIIVVVLTKSKKEPEIEDEDYNPFGEELVVDEPMEEFIEDPLPPSFYTPEEITELIRYGYSVDEIDDMSLFEKDFIEAIEEKKALNDQYLKERYIELKDLNSKNSQAFKELIAFTWLQGQPNEVVVGGSFETHQISTENCRYTKVPVRGNQLMIRVTLESDSSIMFYTVTPERWVNLKEEGNIVLKVQYVIYNNVKFIVGAEEIIPG